MAIASGYLGLRLEYTQPLHRFPGLIYQSPAGHVGDEISRHNIFQIAAGSLQYCHNLASFTKESGREQILRPFLSPENNGGRMP